MKPQVPQRPTTSSLSAAAILASLRANSVTPNAYMSRPKMIQRGLANKFESSSPLENIGTRVSTEPTLATVKFNNEKKNGEEPSEFSLEVPKPFIEMKKGILIRKKEKSVVLVNNITKPSEEEKRRASVLRLFSEPPCDPIDTSMTKERDKTLQNIKGTHDLLEDFRSSPYNPAYSIDSKKQKKVSFIFNPDSPEIPERTGSSRIVTRINRNTKSTWYNDRAAITVAKNRALQLIAENIKPSPKIILEGLTLGMSSKNNDKTPVILTRELRLPSRERENIRIQTPSTLGIEWQAPLDTRDTPSEQKQNEPLFKKNTFVQLPTISTPIIKLNEELVNNLTSGKYTGSSSIKNEGHAFTFPEAPKMRGSLGHSNSVTTLGNSKMPNPYTLHVDRLKKKENSINMSSDSRGKINTQPDSSMNRGLSIDLERNILEAKEEHKRKLLSLLRKQQIPL